MKSDEPKEQEPREPRELRPEGYDIVAADDLRPAGNGRDCFYCGRALGAKHKEDCVIRAAASWYHVAIRDNESSDVRMYRHDRAWDDIEHFQWTENNYSCDCNRSMFFARAAGQEVDLEFECNGGRFSVLYVELPDGSRINLENLH